MIASAMKGPNEHHDQPQEVVASDSWTGGPSPGPQKGRLDRWADAHPIPFMTACVLIAAAALTSNANVVHPMSFAHAALVFVLTAVAIVLSYGSIFLGFWLLGKVVERVDTDKLLGLGGGTKVYLGLLFVAAVIADRLFAPILIGKALGWIGGAL